MWVLQVNKLKEVAEKIQQGSQPILEEREVPQEAESSEVENEVTPTHFGEDPPPLGHNFQSQAPVSTILATSPRRASICRIYST